MADPTPRTRAIVIYPMNALANSQLEELKKFLGSDSATRPMRFGRYTGQESDEERHAMAAPPPDVLLTNFMILELLMTRQTDIDKAVMRNATPVGALGFLRSNGNLFNVAITRARGLLHVVGDRSAAAACGVDYLANFSSYVAGPDGVVARPAATRETIGPEFPSVSRPERVSDWERILYRALYAAGLRPIPQFSVEQYDLDFAIIVGERPLDIEVDGERYHRSWTGELCLRDQLRNMRLIEPGWEVRRFWVYEVHDDLDACVAAIPRSAQAAEEAAA